MVESQLKKSHGQKNMFCNKNNQNQPTTATVLILEDQNIKVVTITISYVFKKLNEDLEDI